MGSILGKILDIYLLKTHGHILETNDLQFGFKRKHSSSQCTFAVTEVKKYYNNKKSNVHVMLLDASQAFDRVNSAVLFRTLLDHGLCAVMYRKLLHLYTYQIMLLVFKEGFCYPHYLLFTWITCFTAILSTKLGACKDSLNRGIWIC